MNTAFLQPNSFGFLLVGALDFATTPSLWQQSQTLLATAPTPVQLDLNEVTYSDSSSVALLLAWQRYAQQLGKEIYFLNVPIKMQAIIKVSELENILKMQRG